MRRLTGLPPEILALPLPGHSRGHAAIAVDTGHGWLVHAGDAYFHRPPVPSLLFGHLGGGGGATQLMPGLGRTDHATSFR